MVSIAEDLRHGCVRYGAADCCVCAEGGLGQVVPLDGVGVVASWKRGVGFGGPEGVIASAVCVGHLRDVGEFVGLWVLMRFLW